MNSFCLLSLLILLLKHHKIPIRLLINLQTVPIIYLFYRNVNSYAMDRGNPSPTQLALHYPLSVHQSRGEFCTPSHPRHSQPRGTRRVPGQFKLHSQNRMSVVWSFRVSWCCPAHVYRALGTCRFLVAFPPYQTGVDEGVCWWGTLVERCFGSNPRYRLTHDRVFCQASVYSVFLSLSFRSSWYLKVYLSLFQYYLFQYYLFLYYWSSMATFYHAKSCFISLLLM